MSSKKIVNFAKIFYLDDKKIKKPIDLIIKKCINSHVKGGWWNW